MAVKARNVQEGKREIRTGAVRTGSRGTDVLGRVGCGAAGSVQRIGRAITGTERWVLAVEAFNG